MKFGVLKCLVEFMYCGKTQCLEENVDELVAAAQFLKIKGLSKVTRESLGITSTDLLPVFTPPVVISRPPQSIIDLHAKDIGNTKTQSAQSNATLAENRNKVDTVLRIPFDIESCGNAKKVYMDPAQYVRPRRGRPSLRRATTQPQTTNNTWESISEIGRTTERALLRGGEDSGDAIQQKKIQSQNMQDYMDRLTLSHAVNSICEPESSTKSYIENDPMFTNQTTPQDIFNYSIPYTKGTLSNETITASYSASSTVNVASTSINNTMSQYVNALKNAGLPTDLPILFESGDGSYINVNEQVLLDMVQSSEIQYEVIEQPNLIEKVSDINEIKSIDDLSKSIERGEMLMDTTTFSGTSNFSKENTHNTINSLNEILPDNLDAFNDQTNYDTLESNLSRISSIQNDNTDLSCIDNNDLHFFTKSMSDDVKKYYEEPHLNDSREIEQYCPVSTTLDTSFNMSLLDTKSIHLMNEAYPSDLSRNDDCFILEHQLPNPNDFKDETLDYLITTPKRISSNTNYDEENQNQERNKIINDLMNIEISINNNKDRTGSPNIPDEQYAMPDDLEPVKSGNRNVQSPLYLPNCETLNNMEKIITKSIDKTESRSYQDSFESSVRKQILDKTNMNCKEFGKCEDISKVNMEVTSNQNIPLAVGLLPLQKVITKEDTFDSNKRKYQHTDNIHDIDTICLKRKMKHKKK